LGVILVAVPLVSAGTFVATLVAGEGAWAAGLSCVFIVTLYAGLVWPVRYGLGDEHLIVRFGLVRQRVPYRNIRLVRPTRSPLSSPALSLWRLRVEYGAGFLQAVMISPAQRDAFLDALAARTGLTRRDDVLRPATDLPPDAGASNT
jgi:hypothetical protein